MSHAKKLMGTLLQLRKLAPNMPEPYKSEMLSVLTQAELTVKVLIAGAAPQEGDPPADGVYLALITLPTAVRQPMVAEWNRAARTWSMPGGKIVWWSPKFDRPQPVWRLLPEMEVMTQTGLL